MSGTHAAITTIEQTTCELLTYLHRGGRWFYYWTNPGKRSDWRPVGNPNPVPNGRANIYFGVHPTNERKGENERAKIADVAAISCLFAEFDAKDFDGDKTAALTHVDGLDLAPSAVIDSGGGYHCYWLLAEPYTLTTASKRERARTVQRRWVELVGGDPGSKDLARVLRVPETRNLKYDERPLVTVVRADFDRLYNLDVLEALLPEEAPVSIPKAKSANRGDAWAEAALADELAKMTMATEGTRNDTLNRAAYALGQIVGAGYLTRTEVEQALYRAGLLTGLSESETWATINSGIEAGLKRPRGPKEKERNRPAAADHSQVERGSQNLTDLGNARRLVRLHGADLRYCHPWKRWFVWDARRWAKDDTGEVMRRAKDTVRLIYAEATNIPDEDGRKAVAKHAIRSEGVQRLRAMITLGESEPGIPVLPIELDQNPWQLNVLNGTLDLRTGELRPHNRSDHITKLAPVHYDPAATCPLWLSFLDHIMGGNAELVHFLQRALGYSLTGDTSEQVIFILYGTGANGKTTLLKTVGSMVGDYGQQTPIDTLMVRRGNTIPNDVARLRGARFVTAVEAEEGQRLAESLIKQMTGQDKIAARFLHAEFFEFSPTFKIWLATNHKPAIRGTDYAIWRRIRLIPFSVTIPDIDQDQELGVKLLAELDGILAWAVQGCLEWQRNGLGMPAEVKKATRAYRDEMDIIGSFLDDCCIVTDTATTRASQLYQAYQDWCEDNGERPMSGTRFGRRMSERGFDKVKDTYVYYLGLGLLADWEEGKIPF